MKLPALQLCLSLFLSIPSLAQHYHFKHLEREEGLPNSHVFDVKQDSKGYLWFATIKGIFRYDGKDYKAYGSNKGFIDRGCFHIFIDKQYKLWFISLNFQLYALEGDSLKRYFPDKAVGWIDTDKNGNLYGVSRSGEVFSFSGKSLHLTKTSDNDYILYYITVLKKHKGILYNSIKYVNLLREGKVTRLKIYKHPEAISRTFELADGRVLIADLNGIHQLNMDDLSTRNLFPIRNTKIFCCYEDSITHDLWFGTHDGIYRFKKGVISKITLEKIGNRNIGSIFRDKEGTLWFTTLGEGVFYDRIGSLHYTTSEGLPVNEVHSIKKQGDCFYLFPHNSRFTYIRNKKIYPLKFAGTGIPYDASFQPAKEGAIYISAGGLDWKLDQGSFSLLNPDIYERNRKEKLNHYFLVTVDSLGNLYLWQKVSPGSILLY
jgi:ligand-binding sensor domain-containing protein